MYVYTSFSSDFEGGMSDLVVLVPDHCLSFYLSFFRSFVIILPVPYSKAKIMHKHFNTYEPNILIFRVTICTRLTFQFPEVGIFLLCF